MGRFGVIAIAVGVFASASAQADPSPSDRQQRADTLFQEGRKLLVEGNDANGACAKFKEAIEYDPNGDGIMLNLGLCNEKLGKFKSALYWFRKAQTRASESNAPDNERAARDHTTSLASMVATVRIAFANEQAGASARVKIDGEAIRPEDYAHVEVDPGHHALEAGASGMRRVHQEFDVQNDNPRGQTLTIELVPGESAVVVDRGHARKVTAMVVAGGGGLLWIASGGLSWYEKSRWDDVKAKATMGDLAARKTSNDAASVAEWYGTSLFVAGTAAIGVAAYLYFTAPSKEVIEQTVFVPTVSPDGIGFAASGRF